MSQAQPTRKSYILMVGVAVLSGLFAAFMNLALAYGEDITSRVREAGAAPQWAPFAVWPIAFLGGATLNLTYSLFLLFRNKTWHHFGGGAREILNPVLSACLWYGGVFLYSSATTYLGILGVSIGFGLFFVVLMLAGQMMGLFTGEWRQVPSTIYSKFAIGVAFLFSGGVYLWGGQLFFYLSCRAPWCDCTCPGTRNTSLRIARIQRRGRAACLSFIYSALERRLLGHAVPVYRLSLPWADPCPLP